MKDSISFCWYKGKRCFKRLFRRCPLSWHRYDVRIPTVLSGKAAWRHVKLFWFQLPYLYRSAFISKVALVNGPEHEITPITVGSCSFSSRYRLFSGSSSLFLSLPLGNFHGFSCSQYNKCVKMTGLPICLELTSHEPPISRREPLWQTSSVDKHPERSASNT